MTKVALPLIACGDMSIIGQHEMHQTTYTMKRRWIWEKCGNSSLHSKLTHLPLFRVKFPNNVELCWEPAHECSMTAYEPGDKWKHTSIICRNERVCRRGFSEGKENSFEASVTPLRTVNSIGSQRLFCWVFLFCKNVLERRLHVCSKHLTSRLRSQIIYVCKVHKPLSTEVLSQAFSRGNLGSASGLSLVPTFLPFPSGTGDSPPQATFSSRDPFAFLLPPRHPFPSSLQVKLCALLTTLVLALSSFT